MSPRPYALLAEVTYRCPLHCPYCSNPTSAPRGSELSAEEWARVFREAAALGVLHAGLSGGEPLARADLETLVAAARAAGLYTNLLTSGLGLTAARAVALRSAGLDSLQLSIQADEAALADGIAGVSAHAHKIAAARHTREAGLPLSLNVVLHRANLDRLAEIIAFAESLGAIRLELAHTQYLGWAWQNRAHLLPTTDQVRRAAVIAAAAQERLRGRLEIFYVAPDWFEGRPKPCLHGWGQRFLAVNPVGDVLPCPTAGSIPGLAFENVRTHSLRAIWQDSAAFQRFRGTAWLPEPCASCPQRELDFGGCRCQAALLTGDAAATDPACALAPARPVIDRLLREPRAAGRWTPRQYRPAAPSALPK